MTITLNKSVLRKSVSLIIKTTKDFKKTYQKQAQNPSHEDYFDYHPAYDKAMALLNMFNAFSFNSKAQTNFDMAKRNLNSVKFYDEKALTDNFDDTTEDQKLVISSASEAIKGLQNFKKNL